MRLDFLRRNRISFYRPRREFQDVMGAAARDVGPNGIDSLDVLAATMQNKKGANLARRLGADPAAITVGAREARSDREPAPGLSADAKAVIEAAMYRALVARRDPGVAELLLGLATAECQARAVLAAHGISGDRLAGLVGGPPSA